jgi:hypothetical protein
VASNVPPIGQIVRSSDAAPAQVDGLITTIFLVRLCDGSLWASQEGSIWIVPRTGPDKPYAGDCFRLHNDSRKLSHSSKSWNYHFGRSLMPKRY